MHSYDLFRTLVHSRDGRPGEDEIENHYPIKENVSKVLPGDLIVSDYEVHRTNKAVAIVRNVCGLQNEVIVTDGGKHRGEVWKMLPGKPVTHTGDHCRSDVESPNQAGIKGIYTQLHEYTPAEAKLVELKLPQLALLCRQARLMSYTPKHRGIEIVQTNYNFPVLFLASVMLNRRYPSHTLLMSARDCFMWSEMMQFYFGRGKYWYTSCHARISADETYHRYIKSLGAPNPLLVDLSGSGGSFSTLPQYESVLFYKPLRANKNNNIPALFQSEDVWRLEQCNRAPHKKCMGVEEVQPGCFAPIWLDRECSTPVTREIIELQVESFRHCLRLSSNYKLEFEATDEQCTSAMNFLLHKYIDFAACVEPLRQLDIAEDRE